MSDKKFKLVELDSLKIEDGAHELATSPEMQPYLRFIEAALFNRDTTSHVQEIASLPLDKRYVWRVASALKWAFADLETMNVGVDRETLSEDDLRKLTEMLRLRPIQFCVFLKAPLGADAMERLMSNALIAAKQDG